MDFDKVKEDIRSRLRGECYLDYAGAALYSSFQVEETARLLVKDMCGHPASSGSLSTGSVKLIDQCRDMVLKHFAVSKESHAVVFTSGATAAFNLVGSCLPWTEGCKAIISSDAHQSLMSIKDIANRYGAQSCVLHPWQLQEMLQRSEDSFNPEDSKFALFAFPGESNFSGRRYRLEICSHVKRKGVSGFAGGQVATLVDGAKLASTSQVDLSENPDIDIFVMSFYKLFGYPTGLAAMVVKKRSVGEKLLKRGKSFFGGGTVAAYSSDGFIRPKSIPEDLFEDGSLNMNALVALKSGFHQLERIGGVSKISQVVCELKSEAVSRLEIMAYSNGEKLVTILDDQVGPDNDLVLVQESAGSVIAFVLNDQYGNAIGHKTVERYAALEGIALRTGCMCSPGACHRLLGLSSADVQAQFESGHVCGDDKMALPCSPFSTKDIVRDMRTGAVRVSFGLASTMDDVDKLVDFLGEHFLSDENKATANAGVQVEEICVKRIVVYPVKGLGGMDVERWKIGPNGLSQDRRFSVIELGVKRAISLKKNPRMAFVEAEIDPAGTSLTLKISDAVAAELGFAAGEESISVPLEENSAQENREIRVCGRMEQVRDVGFPSCWEWLSRGLKADVRIVEGVSQMQNEEALLVVSRATVRSLNDKLIKDGKLPADEDVFRGNVYVETSPNASADFKGRFNVGELAIANVKPCVRCMAVNVDGSKGTSREDSEPLRTLARERYKHDHKVVFGDLFAVSCPEGTTISSGAVLNRMDS